MTIPDNDDPKVVYLPTTGLLAVLVTIATWFFTGYAYLGDKDPLKQGICSALSVAATIFLVTVGRKAMSGRWPVRRGQQIGITPSQACWVTVLVIAAGCFHMWMLK
jgi:hypothetical protein